MTPALAERVVTFIGERDPFGDHFSAHDLEQIEGRERFVGIHFGIPRITTEFWLKPIPDRRHDWQAWYGDFDLGVDVGEGATEAEAIADLVNNYDAPAA